MRNLTYRWPQSGQFCPKLGHFFPIFEKGQGGPPPPPPSSYSPETNDENYHELIQIKGGFGNNHIEYESAGMEIYRLPNFDN